MAEEEEVTSQNQSSNYSSESICHENPREAYEKMLKSFYGIEDSHLKLKEENAKLLAERQDLEDLKSKNTEMLESISQLEKQSSLDCCGEAAGRKKRRCSSMEEIRRTTAAVVARGSSVGFHRRFAKPSRLAAATSRGGAKTLGEDRWREENHLCFDAH
nr:lisH domain-containing protein C1711.05-like [Ipomoea batatas]